ncbi:hypothetical protein HZS_7094, partial [Henneguya salminicola]
EARKVKIFELELLKNTIEETVEKNSRSIHNNRISVHRIVKKRKPRWIRTKKKLTAAREIKIKGRVDENWTISFKTISNKCRLEFGVSICKPTAAHILAGFSYTLKRIHIVHKRRNVQDTLDSC